MCFLYIYQSSESMKTAIFNESHLKCKKHYNIVMYYYYFFLCNFIRGIQAGVRLELGFAVYLQLTGQ